MHRTEHANILGRPRLADELLHADEGPVLHVRVRVRHELHHLWLRAQAVGGPVITSSVVIERDTWDLGVVGDAPFAQVVELDVLRQVAGSDGKDYRIFRLGQQVDQGPENVSFRGLL